MSINTSPSFIESSHFTLSNGLRGRGFCAVLAVDQETHFVVLQGQGMPSEADGFRWIYMVPWFLKISEECQENANETAKSCSLHLALARYTCSRHHWLPLWAVHENLTPAMAGSLFCKYVMCPPLRLSNLCRSCFCIVNVFYRLL